MGISLGIGEEVSLIKLLEFEAENRLNNKNVVIVYINADLKKSDSKYKIINLVDGFFSIGTNGEFMGLHNGEVGTEGILCIVEIMN